MDTNTQLFKIEINDVERGGVSKIEDTKHFETEADALYFCDQFNKKNDEDYMTNKYHMAKYIGKV